MVDRTPELAGVTIVLIGSFNPRLFQPSWFSRQGLISEEEADNAEVGIIHPQAVSFSLDWLHLQVTESQFIANTTEDPYEALRDLVAGTFTLLSFTPITRMGINREVHLRMPSDDVWHEVGHRLVPPAGFPFLKNAGMASVTEQGERPDDYDGYVRVKVEPSTATQPGVYVQVNDHFQWDVEAGETAAPEAVAVLDAAWESSLSRASAYIEALLPAD